MATNDATIVKIKHEILEEVAKLVFAGKFEEEKDELPLRLMPGPTAKYRCCVYKEREIVRQRVRLAEGRNVEGAPNNLVVQVVRAACEECPISRYVVTDNCQKCMGKACQQSCRFGAIDIGRTRAHINPSLCKECGKCAKACPYNAIADLIRPCKRSCPVNAMTMDEYGVCQIDESKCIQCGHCIHSCPFGAISSKAFLVDVVKALVAGKRVVAMIAPSAEGQFGDGITIASWREALQQVGFADLVEVALGADMTANAEAAEWMEAYQEGKKKTTSCCPAFVNMIEKHYPMLKENVSTTVSPMCAVSRKLKAEHPGTITVFIGPCVAKKSEVLEQRLEGNADYVLTFGEIRAIIRAKGVTLKPEPNEQQDGSVFGKRFGDSGGVTAAVLESMKEQGFTEEVNVHKCNGAEECKKALLLMKLGRLPADFVEGMACVGGCVGGPSRHIEPEVTKRNRDKLIGQADDRNISENLHRFADIDSINMHRSASETEEVVK